jgi:gluconate 2-dehydrogenase gamma chain
MRSKQKSLRRRKFLGIGLSATFAGSVVSCGGKRRSRWRFFTSEEAAAVEAMCEQIIPQDSDAGARQAGVVNYIDLQLTRHFKPYQSAYRQGLAAIDAESRAQFGKPFAGLPFARQTEILTQTQKTDESFFNLIHAHTMQGFYGDPRHGGNRDSVSWTMLGLPFPPVRGRAHFEKRGG